MLTKNDRPRRARRGTALAACLSVLLALSVGGPAAAAGPASISSSGPLDRIRISEDLNCDVHHASDNDPAFFGSDACATLVAVGGELFGPDDIPAGSGARPRTAFTPVSQSAVTGSGTSSSPYTIRTVVALGGTRITLTQVDTYVVGKDAYSTSISVQNAAASPTDLRVYRAADCYLANSDVGYGSHGSGWAACLNEDRQRILQLTDRSASASTYQATYSSVWAAIGAQQSFDNSCVCDEAVDNGLGLSWDVRLAAGSTRVLSSTVAFTPDAGADDRDGDGLKDDWETNGVTIGGVHLPLDDWGARPDHRDVFLQVNWMATHWTLDCSWSDFLTGCTSRSREFAPTPAELADVVEAFKKAPVENPDGTQGIALHIDAGSRSPRNTDGAPWPDPLGGMALQYRQGFFADDSTETVLKGLADARARTMGEARRSVFHLALLGDRQTSKSQSTGVGEMPGTTFFVARGRISTGAQVSRTVMHELGHNLNLDHGGAKTTPDHDVNCKPAYRSVMNYLYQLRGSGLDYERTTTRNNPAPPRAQIQDCITSGGEPYVTAPYDAYADWPELMFDAGDIGGLSAGSLADPGIQGELSYADLEQNGLAADDGDGGIEILGPTVMFEGSQPQAVTLRANNPGNVRSSYVVELKVPGSTVSKNITLDAHSSEDVQLVVRSVTGTSIGVEATIRSGDGKVQLATTSLTLPVLANDPEAAGQALADLEGAAGSVPADVLVPLSSALQQVVDQSLAPAVVRLKVGGTTFGTAAKGSVKIVDTAGKPVTGKVGITGAGPKQTLTLRKGAATFRVPKLIAPGSYTVKASYLGNEKVAAASDATSLTVKKAGVKSVKVKLKKKPSQKQAGTAAVSLKSKAAGVKVDGAGLLLLTTTDRRIEIPVRVVGGKASVAVPKLAKGTWRYSFRFSGSETHLSGASKSYRLKVK